MSSASRPLKNWALTLAYDGTDFQGWQSQPGYRTVQETVETALKSVLQEAVRLNVSGRTDAGVHARGQVANFYSRTRLTAETLIKAINAYLPADVSIWGCQGVTQSFDANKDALSKCYEYRIYDRREHDPFLRRTAHHHRKRLDVARMHTGAQLLLGRHDFRSFETNWPNRLSSIRTMHRAEVERVGPEVVIRVAADGFLYNMVRAIAGTLIKVGRGEWPPDYVETILRSQDRREAGPNAPPEGLTLALVEYPPDVFKPCC